MDSYPVRLEGDPTEPLSRWLWLVKWFLLIPHYICLVVLWITLVLATIAVFFVLLLTGGGRTPGLVGILVFVVAMLLLFKKRFSRDAFDVLMGFNRWGVRVAAYLLFMTPHYPPFRLHPGGSESS